MQRDLAQIVRGFLMGGADVVPGVSGGTIALILGIYERLVSALGSIDGTFVGHLRKGRLKDAAEHADLRFLAFLLMGIGLAVVLLASLMNTLLREHRTPTLAAFTGMILASTLLVARQVRTRSALQWTAGCLAALFAFWLTGLQALQSPPEGKWFVVLCGSIAICAMILPGISGAFLLLILGQYEHVTGSVKTLASGSFESEPLMVLVTFGIGAVVGLLSFVRVLQWLLRSAHDTTLAVLTGFMLGSLRKIWPFQNDLTPDVEKMKLKTYENVLPSASDSWTWIALGIVIVGFAFVITLDRFGSDKGNGLRPAESEVGS